MGASTFAPLLSPAELGKWGEDYALKLLRRRGYRIAVTNFEAPLGRGLSGRSVTGEIDLIGYDPEAILCFIEVKARSTRFVPPETNVDLRKRRQIIRCSRIYRRVLQLEQETFRYDVVSIIAIPGEPVEALILKGYFTDQVFKRSTWIKKY